jgi:hypothetical protein
MLTHVLVVLGVLAVIAAFVLISPTRVCARCHGQRMTKSRWNGRLIPCPRCKAQGVSYRRGAVIVHRAYQALRAAIREARKQREVQ